MAKLIPAAERITRARAMIQKARDLPVPRDGGKYNLHYMAQVKEYLRQARDLVKFIPKTVGISMETKEAANSVLAEAKQANKEILH